MCVWGGGAVRLIQTLRAQIQRNTRKGESALSLLGRGVYLLLSPDIGAPGSWAVGLGLEFHP